eukprot:TRINITY_DN72965_c0_g1_i1.p1 TRINITY_DN72965_c0_g1~~TRINITY_DN72965_c0_g1_i1.p1  ORF type:complete len:495 (-),score=81.37 TRINITY_DN72965_c0_g1_i1:506-1990(-)
MCCQSRALQELSTMPVIGPEVEEVDTVKTTPASSTATAQESFGGDFQSPLARWLAEPITFELADVGEDKCAWNSVPARLPAAESDDLRLCPAAPEASFSVVPVPAVLDPAALNYFWVCAPLSVVPVALAPSDAVVHSTSLSTSASSCQSVAADVGSDDCEPSGEMPRAPKLSASAARRRRRQKAAAYAAAAAASRGDVVLHDAEQNPDGSVQHELVEHVQQTRMGTDCLTQHRCKELSVQCARGGDSLSNALRDIRGSVRSLSTDSAGCRLVQDALQAADHRDAASLALELRGHVWTTIASPHGNYVVQKMIEVLPASLVAFVAEELRGYALETACHRYGCRVLCRLLEHSASEPSTVALIDEVLKQTGALSSHEYGHYVIESVLEHGNSSHASRVARELRLDLPRYCQDRHATYVIKAALAHGSADCQKLADELLADAEQLLMLAEHRYGHHVVVSAFRLPSGNAHSAQCVLRQMAPQLKSSVFGSRVLEALM